MRSMRNSPLSLVSVMLAALLVVTIGGLLSGCTGGKASDAAASGTVGTSGGGASGGGASGGGGGASGGGASPAPPAVVPVSEGLEAPDFSYTTIEGASARLSEHRGSVVLINLWASWCGPCISEMPDIGQLKQENPELVVLAVNVSDDPNDARNYIDEADHDFTWILDESGEISSLYPTDGIPYTVIVDKNGTVSSIFLGSPRDPLSEYSKAIQQAGI